MHNVGSAVLGVVIIAVAFVGFTIYYLKRGPIGGPKKDSKPKD